MGYCRLADSMAHSHWPHRGRVDQAGGLAPGPEHDGTGKGLSEPTVWFDPNLTA